MTRPTLIDLNLDEYNMITKTNESKTLAKHISCRCNCKFDGRNVTQIKSGKTITVNVSGKI